MRQHLFLPDIDGVILDSIDGAIITHPVAYRRTRGEEVELQYDITQVPEHIAEGIRRLRPFVATSEDYARILHYLHSDQADDIQEDVSLEEQISLNGFDMGVFRTEVTKANKELTLRPEMPQLIRLYEPFAERYKEVAARHITYHITNKPRQMAEDIFSAHGLPHADILDRSENKTKCDRIHECMEEYEYIPEDQVHFIEDNVHALLAAQGDPRLRGIQLYLADWGYVSNRARRLAQEHGIPIVSQEEALANLL